MSSFRSNLTSQELFQFRAQADILILFDEILDEQYRETHSEHECSSRREYEDGEWYCEHLIRSRIRNEERRKLLGEVLADSPFRPGEWTR